ncbi:putative protein kinase RLK-Pelle-CrRLK1L-1 family [Helianthus anomalus]
MATHDGEFTPWLEQLNPELLVIYGIGGSGKTTLAIYIYNLHQRTFKYVSFVENIGSRCRGPHDVLELQEQLLRDIVGGKKRKIPSVSQGTRMIEEALQMKRTLIVLDDIVNHQQLVALLGTGKIHAQSKIIVTTTENPHNWIDFPYSRCQKYEMRLLNDNESSELFCRHAFQSETPKAGFEELVLQAIRYCEGNPLALEVLGSSLSNNDSILYLESLLRSFEREIDARISSVLMNSYMSLPNNSLKELFLHIACFFIGKDMDYVVKILEPDYSAITGIKTLINRCLLSVSPNKKLTMHRLLQEMGKNIIRQESTKFPAKRSRVWRSRDSYKILKKGKGSETVVGLALDMEMLQKEDSKFTSSELKTDALNNMDGLRLLQLNFVELNGSYENFSQDLRWLCWFGFHLRTLPSGLYMGSLVAIDMSYSKLEVFEPPMVVLRGLKILNLKDSHNLFEIRSIFKIPHLETLILWNCYNLVKVCETIGGLKSLSLLSMTGCKNLFTHTKQPTFSFPFSLNRLFLNDCHLECTTSFPLSFSLQPDLQYLNLGKSLFKSLPCYDHLVNLRVLDLRFCSRIKCLLCLPVTLAELYIDHCELLERITFQSPRFTLQEFGYEGCINLYEIEGFIKLQPIAKLGEAELGHMKWLEDYKQHEVCLVGDDELTVGRSRHIQMLYEFGIMSTSLLDIKDPNMTPEYISKTSSLSFDVPLCPRNKRLTGINVTFKYAISGEDWAWFCKVSTSKGVVDLMYNPRVFGKPEVGEVCIWLSYWPIGNELNTGDTVSVSVVVLSGLEVYECGVSLVYSKQETLENNMGWEEILGGDLSGFELSTGAYYLCRRDFVELMAVGRLTPDWFRTEVRGWTKTGRQKLVNQSYSELKTIGCIIDGSQLDNIYNIAEISRSSFGDKTVAFTSSTLEGETKSSTRSELIDETMDEANDKQYEYGDETIREFTSAFDEMTLEESDPYSHKIVLAVNLSSQTRRRKMLKALSALEGIDSINYDKQEGILTVIGDVNPETLISHARKIADINLSSVGPASESLGKQPERRMKSAIGEGEKSFPSTSAHPCRSFSLTEIQSATNDFADELILGKGGFGTVYKGQISSKEAGHLVAIKRLDSMSSQGELEFRAEIDTLCNLRHCHLVSLIGYCDDNKEKALVYEYMPNGTLYRHLHSPDTPKLSWVTRLKIAIGAARGMDYLHTGVGTRYGVIHRDVKSTNILLDANWAAMISDFGLSKIGPTNQSISCVDASVKGTFGYLDPAFFYTGKLTRKTDVYAFGVVLFELLSGRLALDPDEEEDQCSLVRWAQKCVKEKKLDQMVDPSIKEAISTKCLRRFAQMAARCVDDVPEKRPTMDELVTSLQDILVTQEKSNCSLESSSIMGFFGRFR